MTLIYNDLEFAAIIISVYIYNYDIMNINIDIIKQLFEVYISRNSKKENIIIINKFGISCDINKIDDFYSNYAYKLLEENVLTYVLDELKIIQNLTKLINNINENENENENEIKLNEIYNRAASYVSDIKFYCNKKIYISYITELEWTLDKMLNDYKKNIKTIKKDLINTFDKVIKSIYNLDYTII